MPCRRTSSLNIFSGSNSKLWLSIKVGFNPRQTVKVPSPLIGNLYVVGSWNKSALSIGSNTTSSELLFEISVDETFNNKYEIIKEFIKVNDFKTAAVKYSISDTSNKGGQIGWVKDTFLSEDLVELLSKIGSIQVVSGDDQIYKILVDDLGSRGTTRATYQKIKRYVKQNSVYRTYDYKEARKSRVFLEPISLPKDLREVLIED